MTDAELKAFLPSKRLAMFCTKCGYHGATSAKVKLDNGKGFAPCEYPDCGYMAFVEERDYTEDQVLGAMRLALQANVMNYAKAELGEAAAQQAAERAFIYVTQGRDNEVQGLRAQAARADIRDRILEELLDARDIEELGDVVAVPNEDYMTVNLKRLYNRLRDDIRDRETLIKRAVDKFLGWPLPKSFMPDCGITFDGREGATHGGRSWPIGTNLFTAIEARDMFDYVLRLDKEGS